MIWDKWASRQNNKRYGINTFAPCHPGAAFTLIELLIVIGLLGALATLVLPSFRVSRKESLDQIITAEMHDIQRAFIQFYNDNLPTLDQIRFMTNIHLAPLIHASGHGYNFPAYDPDRQRGWRGPYAMSEGTITHNAHTYPALLDPDGNPYRLEMTNNAIPSSLYLIHPTQTNQHRQLIF